ncbi:MAG: hypothetical protein LBU86_07180 [Oscillospiraceae bacterium]|jgi:hypothetical protein|nr:hypothetical protein [Oscillospiraceae bacterium]
MKESVRSLLAVDRRAAALVEEAAEYRKNAEKSLETEKKKLDEELAAHAEKHIGNVGKTEAAASLEQCGQIVRLHRDIAGELERRYLEHHEWWEDELFRRCLAAEI